MRNEILREAAMMKFFADGDARVHLGTFNGWKRACYLLGRTITPASFKALPAEVQMRWSDVISGIGAIKDVTKVDTEGLEFWDRHDRPA